MTQTVLIVDDEKDLLELVRHNLDAAETAAIPVLLLTTRISSFHNRGT